MDKKPEQNFCPGFELYTPEEIGRTYYRIVVEGTPTPFPEVPNSMGIGKNMVGLSNPIYFNFDPEF
uniref:hypothetical protein n=1 Tax=Algoriphagus locisalis TaxID=305507 RepID=UPI000B895FF9|nr:hypothetical protein [Algoriphagus locisalis]